MKNLHCQCLSDHFLNELQKYELSVSKYKCISNRLDTQNPISSITVDLIFLPL
uniref:Uncharacterized protein n=1 Tax=Anguilla anguilla TaxID=7936 RepID=A0A0E9X4J1_ANGAN